MDWQLVSMFFKIVICLPIILLLIYLCAKLGGGKLQDIQNGKYIKVLERVSISKDNALLISKIGNKGYVMSSAQGKVEILMEMKDEELARIESSKGASMNINNSQYRINFKKFKFKREEKNE